MSVSGTCEHGRRSFLSRPAMGQVVRMSIFARVCILYELIIFLIHTHVEADLDQYTQLFDLKVNTLPLT